LPGLTRQSIVVEKRFSNWMRGSGPRMTSESYFVNSAKAPFHPTTGIAGWEGA
jgi:hypothetical protein